MAEISRKLVASHQVSGDEAGAYTCKPAFND